VIGENDIDIIRRVVHWADCPRTITASTGTDCVAIHRRRGCPHLLVSSFSEHSLSSLLRSSSLSSLLFALTAVSVFSGPAIVSFWRHAIAKRGICYSNSVCLSVRPFSRLSHSCPVSLRRGRPHTAHTSHNCKD